MSEENFSPTENNNSEENLKTNSSQPISRKLYFTIVITLGLAAFLTKWFNLQVPTFGLYVQADAREIFVTLGSALTGPLGGIIIGTLAALPQVILDEIPGWGVPILGGHIAAGVLIAYLYKYVIYKYMKMPWRLMGWAVTIILYYLFALIPITLMLVYLIVPNSIELIFGAKLSFIEAYMAAPPSAFNEGVFTFIITSLFLLALPKKYTRPLW